MKQISLLALLALAVAMAPAASPRQSKCPFCQMPVVSDSSAMDFRVTLKSKGKTVAYRCVLCALADAKSAVGLLEIQAASEMKGHPVTITRDAGKWSISPEKAVFAYAEGDHEQCETRYRALTSPEAFTCYTQAHPKVLKNAKQITLAQIIKLAG